LQGQIILLGNIKCLVQNPVQWQALNEYELLRSHFAQFLS